MKPFWDNMFLDLEEGILTKVKFSELSGEMIRHVLESIEDALIKHDVPKALQIIEKERRRF